MTLPSLPDRRPMFDDGGFPTVPAKVWWQSVKRAFDAQDAAIEALRADLAALDARVTDLETP